MSLAPNARNNGKTFEALLTRIFTAYEDRGIATLRKVDPPTRVVGKPPRQRVIYLENPFLDYVGVQRATGRALFIEAKSTMEPRLEIGTEKTEGRGLSLPQINNMERWNQAGAGVCVLWGYGDAIRLVTLQQIHRSAVTRRSVPWDDAWHIPQGPGFIIYDFLPLLCAVASLKLSPQ